MRKEPGDSFSIEPFPRMRQLVLDAGWLGKRRHMIHGFLEFDVSKPRQIIHEHQKNTGEKISFSAFLIACIGKAVDENKNVHAIRTWRNQLILFDDVDILTAFEIEIGDRTFPLIRPIRKANRRTIRSIHDEIRATQKNPADRIANEWPMLMRWFYLLPTFLRRLIYRIVLLSPNRQKEYAGTVGLTSVGMFGKGGGWGLGMPNHVLALTIGGIAEKPTVVNGEILIHEQLSVTLSFDHDVVDGGPAARFSRKLKELVENGYGLDSI